MARRIVRDGSYGPDVDLAMALLGIFIAALASLAKAKHAAVVERAKARDELEAERGRGFVVPVPLAVRIDWDAAGIDIDLGVTGPGGATARYPEDERNRSFGNLMRDEIQAQQSRWEVFYSMDAPPGRYSVLCSYYSPAGPDVEVKGVVVLHPADAHRRAEKSFRIRLRPSDKYPRRKVAEFDVVRDAKQDLDIRFGSFEHDA